MGENGGSEKLNDPPPSNFRADISDEKDVTAVREEMKLSKEYLDWLVETYDLFFASVAQRETKMGEKSKSRKAQTSNWSGRDQVQEMSLMQKKL